MTYGIFDREREIVFDFVGEEEDKNKQFEQEEGGFHNATMMKGDDGSLHIVSRSTRQDIEASPMYHEWLQLGKLIRIT